MNKDRKRRLIGILVSAPEKRKPALKRYLPYAAGKDVLIGFTPRSIDWDKRRVTGLYHTGAGWEIGTFPLPDVVYNRCYEIQDSLIRRLESVIGQGKCFNHRNKFHKLETYRHLRKSLGEHLPATIPFEEKAAAQMLMRHPVLYFKPCFGSGGKGVIRAARQADGGIHIGDHYFTPETIVYSLEDFQKEMKRRIGGKPYLVQAGIPVGVAKGQIFDLRALVQKNGHGQWDVTSIISRIASPGSFNTSLCDAVRRAEEVLSGIRHADEAGRILSAVREIGLTAAAALEKKTRLRLGELSVDLALDDRGKLWIIEVNGKPQKSLYDEIEGGSEAYRRPMEYAHYLAW